MRLQHKTLLLLGLTFLVLIAAIYAASSRILLRGYAAVEIRETQEDARRALDAIDSSLATLNSKVGDWSVWDDSYNFIETGDPSFIRTNATDKTFAEIRIELLAFVHRSGRVAYTKAFDLERNIVLPVPEELARHLGPDSPLLQHADLTSSRVGLLQLPQGVMLVASRPLRTSEGLGPIRGTLIFGRYLDAAEMRDLSQLTHLDLAVFQPEAPEVPRDFRATWVPEQTRRLAIRRSTCRPWAQSGSLPMRSCGTSMASPPWCSASSRPGRSGPRVSGACRTCSSP